ncbi:hypothetical protein VKT23_017829 [Stygiomarasmius scandens]|uniref:Costars domain-containing protein n=1 Tax=Marasmiellus scandens TaxID=2682957 RepID=A0ABR1IQZ6_9AGAR
MVQEQYREVNVSYHRPVSAVFGMTVKSVRKEVRERVKEEVKMRWVEESSGPDMIRVDILIFFIMVNVSDEIVILKDAIKENGSKNSDGKYSVSYGILFDKTANTLEALNGTLRAAKKQKKVAFDAELLMMPRDKDVQVTLLED